MTPAANGLPVNLRAILFDFDGTLADSYDAITASVNYVRAAHGMSPITVEDVRGHVGHGPTDLLNQTVGVGDPQENTALYRKHHPSVMRQMTVLLPGAKETLTTVKKLGYETAICSNKPRAYIEQLLEVLQIDALVDVVLGPEDVLRRKPAPDMLLAGIDRLGLVKEQVLYVGDMTVDVESARAAGVSVWIVATGSDDKEMLEAARPDRLLNSMTEMPPILQQHDLA